MIKFNTLRQLVFQSLLNDSSRLMALMLLCLHGYLMFGQTHYMQLAFVMSHVGFFLMWQPLLRQSESLSWRASLAIVVIASIAIALINWWTIAFWIAGLFALIGGRVFSTENARKRLPFTLAAIYLLAILLLWVVPMLLSSGHDLIAAQFVLTYLLPVLPLLILYLTDFLTHHYRDFRQLRDWCGVAISLFKTIAGRGHRAGGYLSCIKLAVEPKRDLLWLRVTDVALFA